MLALCLDVHVSPAQPTTSTHRGPRHKPSSENRPWGGITARASTRTARLSRLWRGRIYWISERAFSPSPALSATCLETGLHYRWAPGSRYTLTALRLPHTDTVHAFAQMCKQHLCGATVSITLSPLGNFKYPVSLSTYFPSFILLSSIQKGNKFITKKHTFA